MSWDNKAVEKVLKYLHPGVVGGRDTALYESLFRAGELFVKEPLKNRVIILLTDGIDTVGNIPLDVVINRLKKLKIRVYTIGVGDDFRKNVLKRIADKTGGQFYSASNPKNLEKIYSEIDKIEKSPIKTFSYTKDIHYYRYPLFLAIVGVLIYLPSFSASGYPRISSFDVQFAPTGMSSCPPPTPIALHSPFNMANAAALRGASWLLTCGQNFEIF